MKRFYRTAEAVSSDMGGFVVLLDGRPVRTPGQRLLALPAQPLAEAIAGEWTAQGEIIEPLSMPMLRLANSCLDRVSAYRGEVVATVSGFAASDLVCYRAEAPPDLVARQHRAWDPLLDWLAGEHGARLATTAGVAPIEQPADALDRLRIAVEARSDFDLAALHELTVLTGSLVIGLGVLQHAIEPAAGWMAAHVDEAFQQERWGEDSEAAKRLEARRREFEQALRFVELGRG